MDCEKGYSQMFIQSRSQDMPRWFRLVRMIAYSPPPISDGEEDDDDMHQRKMERRNTAGRKFYRNCRNQRASETNDGKRASALKKKADHFGTLVKFHFENEKKLSFGNKATKSYEKK